MAGNVSGGWICLVKICRHPGDIRIEGEFTHIGIVLMVFIAGISWLFFAIVPPPYNIVFLFTNGFPFGLVWGMIFGYMEGRRYTEVLGAGLAVSFIFSAGLAKSAGGFIMRDWGVSEMWMPFVTVVFSLSRF